MVRADWPGPFAMNVSVTTAPCPETPPAPGGRVAVICSVYFVVLGSGTGEADSLRAVEAALLVNLGLLATAFVLAYRLPHRLAGDLPETAVLDL